MTEIFKQLPIDEASRKNLIAVRISVFEEDVNTLAENLYTGQISLGQWEESMKSLVRGVHSSTAAIGKGGWESMTQSDWGRVGAEVKAQYRYLHGFAEHISDNRETISLNAIQARARLYGGASKHTASMMQAGDLAGGTRRHPTTFIGLPWLPGDGSTECMVNCKCHWELDIVDRTKTSQLVRAIWILTEAEHCDDCIGRNNYTIVLTVPIDIKIPEIIGGF